MLTLDEKLRRVLSQKEIDAFWKAHDKAQSELTPTQKRWKKELEDPRPYSEQLFGKGRNNAKT